MNANNCAGASRLRLILACSFVALSVSFLARSAVGQVQNEVKIRQGYATTATGVRIHYLESGSGVSARTLVLIPGWRLPAYLWDRQLKSFATIARVIALDPRSQGESTKTPDGDTPEARAADLRDVLGALKVSHPILVGWSQGAQDVAAYVQQFGTDSVAGLVFVDSPVSIGPAELDFHNQFSKDILSNIAQYASHPREFSQGMIRSIFKKPHPELDMQKILNSTLQTPTAVGVAMLTTDIFGADRWSVLPKIDKPTLVIASAESPLLSLQKQMAQAIPGAKFVSITDTAHAVFIDQPGQFDSELRTFLQSVPPNSLPR